MGASDSFSDCAPEFLIGTCVGVSVEVAEGVERVGVCEVVTVDDGVEALMGISERLEIGALAGASVGSTVDVVTEAIGSVVVGRMLSAVVDVLCTVEVRGLVTGVVVVVGLLVVLSTVERVELGALLSSLVAEAVVEVAVLGVVVATSSSSATAGSFTNGVGLT